MAIQFIAVTRFALVTVALLSASACNDKPLPIQIEKYCVSESGMSKYWLTVNTVERQGAIRYQYMGQDARYFIKAMQIGGQKVSGRAEFQSSSTGEARGKPIVFTYDNATNTLEDGATLAACQNRQSNEQG